MRNSMLDWQCADMVPGSHHHNDAAVVRTRPASQWKVPQINDNLMVKKLFLLKFSA